MVHQATEKIYNHLSAKGISCRKMKRDDVSIVEAGFSGKNVAQIILRFFSNSEENDVALRAFDIAKYPPDRRALMCVALDEINSKYRYAKFVTNPKENTVQVEMDIPQSVTNVEEAAFELMLRAVRIIDEAYPTIMKVIWGS